MRERRRSRERLHSSKRQERNLDVQRERPETLRNFTRNARACEENRGEQLARREKAAKSKHRSDAVRNDELFLRRNVWAAHCVGDVEDVVERVVPVDVLDRVALLVAVDGLFQGLAQRQQVVLAGKRKQPADKGFPGWRTSWLIIGDRSMLASLGSGSA